MRGDVTAFVALSAAMASAQQISPRVVVEHVEGVVHVDKGGALVRTEDGRAVIRIEGGSLFLGEDSSVKVIDQPYGLVQLGMLTGSAVVITETGTGSAAVVACEEPVTLAASGVYRFDAKRIAMPGQEDYRYCRFRVYQGAAAVQLASFTSVLTSGKAMNLNHVCGDHVQTNGFDIQETDELDRWSRGRGGSDNQGR